MRFTTFVVAGAFALFANAQSTDTTSTTLDTASTTVGLTPAQSSQTACIDACEAGDVNCLSKCIAVPDPSGAQVNATNACVAGCDQGSGSAADTAAYSECVQNCIAENYYTSTGTPAESTGASGSTGTAGAAATTATAASGSASSSSGSSTKTSTSTSSSASSTSTGNAAQTLSVGFTGASLFGVLAAFLAL